MKKVFALLFAIAICVGVATFSARAAETSDICESGTCGENLTWTLTEDGTLTISGSGEMDSGRSWDRNKVLRVILSEGVTSIGEYAFSGYELLESISIPNSVTFIGNDAFQGCRRLKNIRIPDSVTSIGNYAFQSCVGLETISIPESVEWIGSSAFSECTALKNIDIPDGVSSVGAYAFDGCIGLKKVSIPESVTSIGDNVFRGCTGLTEILVDDANTRYSDVEGVLFNKGQSKLICYPASHPVREYSIPAGVNTIAEYAFGDCSNLRKVELSGVVDIGEYAFYRCSIVIFK